jgi:hypothetical protein
VWFVLRLSQLLYRRFNEALVESARDNLSSFFEDRNREKYYESVMAFVERCVEEPERGDAIVLFTAKVKHQTEFIVRKSNPCAAPPINFAFCRPVIGGQVAKPSSRPFSAPQFWQNSKNGRTGSG